MKDALLVSIGGAIGAFLRFFIGGWIQRNILTFPLSTFVINVVGSFMLSLIMYSAEYGGLVSRDFRIFFTIGVLGAFTTFSTLEYEAFRLLEQGKWWFFAADLGGNVLLGLGAVISGKIIANLLWR